MLLRHFSYKHFQVEKLKAKLTHMSVSETEIGDAKHVTNAVLTWFGIYLKALEQNIWKGVLKITCIKMIQGSFSTMEISGPHSKTSESKFHGKKVILVIVHIWS